MKTMPYKEWLYMEASRLQITKRALEMLIHRKKRRTPPLHRINMRTIMVCLPDDEGGVS